MNILFLHRDFPGQFKYIASVLAANPNNLVMFITSENEIETFPGINKLPYQRPPQINKTGFPFLDNYEETILHGQAAANIAITMKQKGIKPDIIYGHSWGSTMFMKDIFPDVPLLCYFEWFENSTGAAIGFDGKTPGEGYKSEIRGSNAFRLIDLCACDGGITPTEWQKQQYPKEFHDKIKVIHDGIDTNICKPNKDVKVFIKDKNLELTANDEVITYATRGMEPYRGFPQFMEAIEKLLVKRPNAHFIIGGTDRVCYGEPLKHGTYKELMLKKLKIDLDRVHFVGGLDFEEYLNILQISSAHIYASYPFVLSWSVLEAMATGCCLIASNTPPVREVIQDNYNGLLYDFFDVNQLVKKIEYALDNKNKMEEIRNNARKFAVEKYDLRVVMPQQILYINSLINQFKEEK